ncbi:MAG: IS30 family transposase [Bacteroidales bacterium]|jgi:IS30 family transposase|nr:IS30 family transposase [Bacteroidales bacterium]
MTKKYHQLNHEQRSQISALKKAGFSNGYIAAAIDVHKTTIGRELRRNASSKGTYNPTSAQLYANDRKTDKQKHIRFTKNMKNLIIDKIENEQWSPEQIRGWCKLKNVPMVSHETIYQYVYLDMKTGGTLYKNLRTQHKRRRKRMLRKDKRGSIPNRISIHQRPNIVNEKQRFGDWEIDLIEGKNHSSFAVTLVERKSQFALIVPAPNKEADTIQTKTINALAPYKELVHTITSDNGKEFANHQYIAQKLQTNYFFADPYSSWQRGLNEYTNKLFRQYLPKKSNLKNYDTAYFNLIQNKLNNRPRKSLGFKTPLQVFIHNFDPN